MFCKNCKAKLTSIDIYCKGCGRPTESFKSQFKVFDVLRLASKQVSDATFSNNIYNIVVTLAIIWVVFIFSFNFLSLSYWTSYFLFNLAMVLLCPLLMIPLASVVEKEKKLQFNFYPKLLLLTFFVAFYFFILRIVCQGDPILNLVRLVMVLWGLAIAFPLFFLIFKRSEGFMVLLAKAYIAGKYLRWHQFCLCVILGLRLLASVILIFIPFSRSMNFTANVMYIWYQKQEEFELYDKNKDY